MKLYCAFIDLEKAFNYVWYIGLWNSFYDNIDGKCYKMITNMYKGIKSKLLANREVLNFRIYCWSNNKGKIVTFFIITVFKRP